MNPDFPKISCILPVYNCEKYLLQAINSILAQSFEDFELIIVDDGSTDDSGSIANDCATRDSRIQVINQPNQGIVSALNVAITASRGKYIARMDADDVSLPHRFERQFSVMEAHPDIVILGCASDTIDGNGLISNKRETSEDLIIRQSVLDSFPPSILQVLHPTTFIRTEILKSIGGYLDDYEFAEDYDLYLRIGAHGQIAEICEVLFQYRIHGNNISIRRLRDQEMSGARSDLFNVNARRLAKNKPELLISENTFRGYITFRCFRREWPLGLGRLRTVLLAAWLVLLGSYRTDPRITVRIATRIGVHLFRWLRERPARPIVGQ